MRRDRVWRWGAALAGVALVAGCMTSAPEGQPSPSAPSGPVPAVQYDLGEDTLVQDWFDSDSRFREMPVQLTGTIAVPEQAGPHPVVMVLHGTHPGCPLDDAGVDRWPCSADDEQRNDLGFAYLASELAARGYVVLVPNINAEYTFGFGEATPGVRLEQLVGLHLNALASASGSGGDAFGVDVTGADVSTLAFFGHSRGGEQALALANDESTLDASAGYGPVAGVLQLAAATTSVDPWTGSKVPLATVQSGCDGDVTSQDGQFFYEGIRLAGTTWATSVWLETANHNGFSTTLGEDPFGVDGRPDCEPLLDAGAQRDWIVDYSADFLSALFDDDDAARARMGLNLTTPAPSELYGQPARVAYLPPPTDRAVVFVPAEADDLTLTSTGAKVLAEGVTTTFCPKGFYTVEMEPGTEACRRQGVVVPGQPSHAVASWEASGGALRFVLADGGADVSDLTAVTLRAAVDAVSELNAYGTPQAFSVRLTDRSGAQATVATRPDEPALRFPAGEEKADEWSTTGWFTGRVPLTSIRMQLDDFTGVDLGSVTEVALVFDQTASGTVYLADVEFARAG